jgi:obg-like ATPase 1
MDPIRDLEIISNELVAKDFQLISKRRDEFKKKFDRMQKAKML